MSSKLFEDKAPGTDIAAALRAMPDISAPEGQWPAVRERHDAERRAQRNRRRYWGGGLAAAASIAVAVVGVRLGIGVFSSAPGTDFVENAGVGETHAEASATAEIISVADLENLEGQLAEMDMDALIEFSRFQEDRLRALPVASLPGPGQVLEMDAFGLVTELEDQIALLDEGLIPVSLDSEDTAVSRRLMQERAMLMDDLFWMRRAEAQQVGFIHADF